jgi:NAD(P)-dependent dehydrogenase (short-subunit alcohol dehydrogenase family)
MKTVLITGASSGIGLAAAEEFSKAGWQVAATMRKPSSDSSLASMKNVALFALDVCDPDSVEKAFIDVKARFGRIDAVINNAGYGVDGVFEAMDDQVIENQFNTNVFGLMRVTRAAISLMRTQKEGGNIIQIASMGGRLAFPAYSIYHGTKWAVEGFSESLHYELKQFNIHVKIIEPGAIKTEFYGRSRKFVKPSRDNGYDTFIQKVEKVSMEAGAKGEDPKVVAQTILKAASDTSNRLRYAVGNPAPALLWLRKWIGDKLFFRIVKMSYGI